MSKKQRNIVVAILGLLVVIIVVPLLSWLVFVHTTTPEYLKKPTFAHHHLRMQLIIDGQVIDFAKSEFQETYEKGLCSDDLARTPIHFHDNINQIVHIHWTGITGGEVLKYYGLNRIGGQSDILGYRTDQGLIPQKIEIKGSILPQTSDHIFVYIVQNDGTIIERSEQDFLAQDIETFLGKKSSHTLEKEEASQDVLNFLRSPNVYAHDTGIPHEEPEEGEDSKIEAGLTTPISDPLDTRESKETENINPTQEKNNLNNSLPDNLETQILNVNNPEITPTSKSQEELKKLNDILGDIIIFIQKEKPSMDQVKSRIPDFVTLDDSQCGG